MEVQEFNQVYEDNFLGLYRFAGNLLRNTSVAADIAQESLIALMNSSEQISNINGWLYRTAKNKARTYMRAEIRRRAREQEYFVQEEELDYNSVDLEIYSGKIDEILDEMPDSLDRKVIFGFLEGETQSETAGRLGVNQSTVSRAYKKSIAMFRKRLREI